MLEALGSVKGFPVPKVYDICLDDCIIGTQFYVLIFFALKSHVTNFLLGDGICQRKNYYGYGYGGVVAR